MDSMQPERGCVVVCNFYKRLERDKILAVCLKREMAKIACEVSLDIDALIEA